MTIRTIAPVGPLRPALIRPLLPAAARPLAWALTACCAVIIAGLAVLIALHTGLDWLDRPVDRWIQGIYSAHQLLLSRLALPGQPIPVAALIVVIAATCLVTGRINGAVLAVVAVPLTSVLAEHLLKPLVGRIKLGFLSYPSGHTAVMFALAAVLTVLMLNPPGRVLTPVLRLIIPAAAVTLACVIVTIVIGVGVHYFTDTIAGTALGVGTVSAIALVLDLPGPLRWLAAADGRLGKLHIRPGRGSHRRASGHPTLDMSGQRDGASRRTAKGGYTVVREETPATGTAGGEPHDGV